MDKIFKNESLSFKNKYGGGKIEGKDYRNETVNCFLSKAEEDKLGLKLKLKKEG